MSTASKLQAILAPVAAALLHLLLHPPQALRPHQLPALHLPLLQFLVAAQRQQQARQRHRRRQRKARTRGCPRSTGCSARTAQRSTSTHRPVR